MAKNQAPKIRRSTWEKLSPPWSLVILSCLVVAIGIVMVRGSMLGNIDSFDKCKDAGGAILESYPEQCLIDGKTYTNTSQLGASNEYVGLSEQDALDKAKNRNVPARVIERDDESLPVTLDYLFGRHNFHVRNGHVYKVDIEGREQ